MSGKRRAEDAAVPAAAEADELEFEDEYGDEFEDEEMASAEEEGGEDGTESGPADGLQPRSGGRMWRASDGMGSGEALEGVLSGGGLASASGCRAQRSGRGFC